MNTILKRLALLKVSKPMAVVCGVAAFSSLSAVEVARSSNTHAIITVQAPSSNVLIAVPWTFYSSPSELTPSNLPVNRLVWPKDLDDGDLLMAVTKESQQTVYKYDTWTLVKETNTGAGHWVTTLTASTDGDTQSNDERPMPRGIGLWLLRQNPQNPDGSWKPVHLYGQFASGNARVKVEGFASETNSVMVANPNCVAMSVNGDITWTGVDDKDTLSLPNGTDAWDLCLWDSTLNKWYCSKSQRVGRKIVTSKNYDLSIPAGRGFWYVRRAAGDITIDFSAK